MLCREEFQLLSDNYDDLREIFDSLSMMGNAIQYMLTDKLSSLPSQYHYIDNLKERIQDAKSLLTAIVKNISGKSENEEITPTEMQLVVMYVKTIDLLLKKLKPEEWKGISNRYNDILFLLLEIAKQNSEESAND